MIALLAVLVLGVPLAVLGGRLLREEAQSRLDHDSAAVAGAIEGEVDAGRLPSQRELAAMTAPGHQARVAVPGLGVVTAGPSPGHEIRESTTTIGRLSVTVSEPADEAEGRVHNLWVLVCVAGAGGLLLAAALAAWQARRLAKPLEGLADVSQRLGRGDLGARAGPQDLPEVDAVARALDGSAEQIGRLVERERAFSSNVAHQIRTPLTALDMRLEELAAHPDPDVRREASAALDQSERLRRTTDDLLAHARDGRSGDLEPLDLGRLLDDRLQAWAPAVAARNRRLVRTGSSGRPVARGSRAAVEQAIDVLVENALEHGAGDIGVETSVQGGFVHVGVADQGAGVGDDAAAAIFAPRHDGRGIGLSLARALLEAGGGRLSLASARPAVFEIVLPELRERPAT